MPLEEAIAGLLQGQAEHHIEIFSMTTFSPVSCKLSRDKSKCPCREDCPN